MIPEAASGATKGPPSIGVLQAGLYLGEPLRADASGHPNTHVFINGREAPFQDLVRLRSVGIVPFPGQRLWVTADGACGVEGSYIACGNAFTGSGFSRAVKLGAFLWGVTAWKIGKVKQSRLEFSGVLGCTGFVHLFPSSTLQFLSFDWRY